MINVRRCNKTTTYPIIITWFRFSKRPVNPLLELFVTGLITKTCICKQSSFFGSAFLKKRHVCRAACLKIRIFCCKYRCPLDERGSHRDSCLWSIFFYEIIELMAIHCFSWEVKLSYNTERTVTLALFFPCTATPGIPFCVVKIIDLTDFLRTNLASLSVPWWRGWVVTKTLTQLESFRLS